MSRSCIVLAACALALSCSASAQSSKRTPKWKIDPYTKNDPAKMAKLGYLLYGPFEFGQRGRQRVTTTQIEEQLSYAQILWVETAHFRIGSALEPWNVPFDPKTRKKIRTELTELKKLSPKIKPKARVIGPWLRLHLIAARMEGLYSEFLDLTGVADSEFPRRKKDVIIGRGRYLGYGPYLGMKNKYLVFVTATQTTYADYLQTFIGKSGKFGQRWHFQDTGSLFYGTSADLEDGRLKHDTGLHCDLVFNVSHGLVDGFRHYSYDAPVWITEGLAHWFQRRVSPRWNSFSQNESALADKKPLWKWEAETRKLVLAGRGTPFSEMYTWRDFSQISFQDHILMWSRWDFLMSFGKEKFSEFIFQVKGRVDPTTWITDQKDLVGATRTALRKSYGLTPLTFDEKWKAWVLENYSTR